MKPHLVPHHAAVPGAGLMSPYGAGGLAGAGALAYAPGNPAALHHLQSECGTCLVYV